MDPRWFACPDSHTFSSYSPTHAHNWLISDDANSMVVLEVIYTGSFKNALQFVVHGGCIPTSYPINVSSCWGLASDYACLDAPRPLPFGLPTRSYGITTNCQNLRRSLIPQFGPWKVLNIENMWQDHRFPLWTFKNAIWPSKLYFFRFLELHYAFHSQFGADLIHFIADNLESGYILGVWLASPSTVDANPLLWRKGRTSQEPRCVECFPTE